MFREFDSSEGIGGCGYRIALRKCDKQVLRRREVRGRKRGSSRHPQRVNSTMQCSLALSEAIKPSVPPLIRLLQQNRPFADIR
jgi:hypothetical protein